MDVAKVVTVEVVDVPEEAELLLPHEAAAMLRLDAKTLSRWHLNGLIRAVVLPSGHRRFFASDVKEILRGYTPPRKPGTRPLPRRSDLEGQLELPGIGGPGQP